MKIKIPAYRSERFNKRGNPAGYILTPEVIAEAIEDGPIDPPPPVTDPEFRAALTKWETNKIDGINYWKYKLPTSDQSVWDHEHSVVYYEGASIFSRLGEPLIAQQLWEVYKDKYGPIGPTPDGYKKRSQWVFGSDCLAFNDMIRLADLCINSCYVTYLDGLQDCYQGSDDRGLAYIVNCFSLAESLSLDLRGAIFTLEQVADTAFRVCNTLGQRNFDLFYMLGMLGNEMMKHEKELSTYGNIKEAVKKICAYIAPHIELDGKLRYGVGEHEEAEERYNELHLLIAPMFGCFPEYEEEAKKLFIYGVNNADLKTYGKAFCQNYLYSIDYVAKYR